MMFTIMLKTTIHEESKKVEIVSDDMIDDINTNKKFQAIIYIIAIIYFLEARN